MLYSVLRALQQACEEDRMWPVTQVLIGSNPELVLSLVDVFQAGDCSLNHVHSGAARSDAFISYSSSFFLFYMLQAFRIFKC